MYNAMKKIFNFVLTAALMGGLSLVAASCSDDKELSEEEKQQQAEQQAEQDLDAAAEFWNVVGQLTDDPMPDEGWQTVTYAPSIGEPDGSNAAVRIVSTADAETAADRFAQLTGANIDESTTDYTYQNEHVGTLKYHRTGEQSLAVVDVDIPQMPDLQQIIYQTPKQMGSNGSFSGTAYYRFGDVVKKKNSDGADDYWICVRPCFGLAGKGDSHWVSVSKIPSANTKQVTKVINRQTVTHSLPKSLTTNREHMQNLAEMLYAMTHSQQWASNLSTNDGYKTLKYFRDFNYQKLFGYNGDAFFYEVALNWEREGLFKTIFGLNLEQMKAELEQGGLNLVYSSGTMSGNKIQLPIANYGKTNLKTETLSKTGNEWTTSFDIQQRMNSGFISYTNADGQQQRAWLVRYATGATLCKGSNEPASFNKYAKLTNCEDVFVFNQDVRKLKMTDKNLKDTEPEKANDNPAAWNLNDYVELPFYEHGDVLVDENGHHWFVINQAGNPDSEYGDKGEHMPFAEVVSFEGFNYSADRKTATNLPTREQAIRGAFWLEMFFTQASGMVAFKRADKQAWLSSGKYPHYGSSVFNVLEYANVEMRDLFQLISAQNGDARQSTHAASIAYNDGTGRMRLLRFIMNNQNEKNDLKYYLWDHYVNMPDSFTQLYPSEAYSHDPIYLDDLTDPQIIKWYAEDTYVRQGQPGIEFPSGVAVASRKPRTETEPLAADASNYVYSLNLWKNRVFYTDMWKAPILMFRMTRIYDRGAADHAATAANGLMMVRIKQHEWEDRGKGVEGTGAEENRNNFRKITMPIQFMNCITPGDWKLDGKDFTFPTWQSLYK